ncbi:MAG TPA: NAD(P)/FAD-dependent oxidoreductase [Dehalococcoidia bacterium]|nr:NAD(P)/FAD-dependent oxidoreductase [Dehalococcoidia bacterium]
MKVGIVGAGVLGMAAARVLQESGNQVVLFESRDEVGGQVETFPVGGEPLECFYHHLFTNDTVAIRYINELGLGSKLRWIEPKNGYFIRDRTFPFVTPMDLIKFTAVPLTSRIRLGLAALWLRRQSNWKKYEQVTARAWMERFVGKKAFAAIWGPLLKGKFAGEADNVGMVWLWGKVYLRFASRQGAGNRESLGYLEGSFKAYYQKLADLIRERGGEIWLSTPVERVEVEDGRVKGITSKGELNPFDRVLLTTPNIITKRIVPNLPGPYVEALDRVKYQWATCLILALDRPLTDHYWLSIGDDLPFVACIEHTNFMPPEAYGGNHIVYFSNYVSPDDPIIGQDVDVVLDLYMAAIQRLNPRFDRSWIKDSWFFKDPGGQPVITTNYTESIPEHETGIDGLYMANTTQVYPEDRGQNYSLRLGERVAQLMMEEETQG